MSEIHAYTAGVPQNVSENEKKKNGEIPKAHCTFKVFTLPTPTDITLTPFWHTILSKDNFLLQKSSSPGNPLFRNLLSTIANV